jgi:hypothetical protein
MTAIAIVRNTGEGDTLTVGDDRWETEVVVP